MVARFATRTTTIQSAIALAAVLAILVGVPLAYYSRVIGYRAPVGPPVHEAAVRRMAAPAMDLYRMGMFVEARVIFQATALEAEQRGLKREGPVYWNSVALCSTALFQYGAAVENYLKAIRMADAAAQPVPALIAANNLAIVYIQIGQFENAARIARHALASPNLDLVPQARATLWARLATALAELHRFDEAVPAFKTSINDMFDQGNLPFAIITLSDLGNNSTEAGRLDLAEWALGEALRLTRIHRLFEVAGILRGLGQLRAKQGDAANAAALFQAAIDAPTLTNPRIGIYEDRGQFRADHGDFNGAFEDFRAARHIGEIMRAERALATSTGASDCAAPSPPGCAATTVLPP
jgi:tetratricopeptide (TPR) repeat protein